MFGFTQSPTSCCQKASSSLYKSFFCGLSCRLKMDYGHAARFLVNRDSTFLSIVGSSLSPNSTQNTMSTCCNPLGTPCELKINSCIQQYSAAVAICGLSAKCDDDAHDHSGIRKLTATSIQAATRNWRDTAIHTLNSLHFPTSTILSTLAQQSAVETPQHSTQEAAAPTAQSYQRIFEHLHRVLEIPHTPELAVIGFHLGQLTYLRDAVDDLSEDLKKGHYNPLQYRDLAECASLASNSLEQFNTAVCNLPAIRHRQALLEIAEQTTAYHSDLAHNPQQKKKKKKSNSCWDNCDCCYCAPSDCNCGSSKSSCDCDGGCGDCCDCDCCSCGS